MSLFEPVTISADPSILTQWRIDEREARTQRGSNEAVAVLLNRHPERIEIRAPEEAAEIIESARAIVAGTGYQRYRAALLDICDRVAAAVHPLSPPQDGPLAESDSADADTPLPREETRGGSESGQERTVENRPVANRLTGNHGNGGAAEATPQNGEERTTSSRPARAQILDMLLRVGRSMGLTATTRAERSSGPQDELARDPWAMMDVVWADQSTVAVFQLPQSALTPALLQISDALAAQSGLIPAIYVVAPDDLREEIQGHVRRPTFSRLSPALTDVCQYIPYSTIERRIAQVEDLLPYLRSGFVEALAEPLDASGHGGRGAAQQES